MREERGLRVFENRDEVTGEWRKLQNEELNDENNWKTEESLA